MSTETVLLSATHDGVLTLTLNRPQRRNALSTELIDALIQAIVSAKTDAAVRCVVITGSGEKAFCSGADLNPAAAAAGPYAMHENRRSFIAMIKAIRACDKPVVARVNGLAYAGGLGLMLACDMAIATDTAKFCTPEIKVGLFPYMIMALIRRHIGPKRTADLVMSGRAIVAPEAVTMGLINRCVPPDELDAAVNELAGTLSSYSPAIMKLGRRAFHQIEDMPVDDALEYLCNQLTINTLTEDAAEGVTAFMMKRPPEWKGR